MYDDLVKRLHNALEDMYDGWAVALVMEAADAIEKLIEVIQNHDFLESLIKPHWIPVTERLPEKKLASYLCLTDGGYCKEVRWTNILYGLIESNDWGWNIFDVPQFSHVTHWMPLPPSPEAELKGWQHNV